MTEPTIIYEDDDMLVVDKPAGIIVNNADTTRDVITLQTWAQSKIQNPTSKIENDSESEFVRRGGIVHRLDRETSGVLIIAKNENSFTKIQSQFKSREVVKKYVALTHGNIPNDRGVVLGKIARVGAFGKFGLADSGRESETHYEVVERKKLAPSTFEEILSKSDLKLNKNQARYYINNGANYSLISVFPKTGRTHQIRVHMKSEGFPLVSDSLYSPRKLLKIDLLWCPRLFLHAQEISFKHPSSGEKVTFSAPLPQDLTDALEMVTLVE